jgi:benzoylformate decarboxylase
LAGLDGPADVVLAIGSYLFKQILYMPGALLPAGMKFIQLDLDPGGLARDCPADIALLASPKTALAELADEIEGMLSDAQREAARQRFDRLKRGREEAREAREVQFKELRDAVPIHPSRAVSDIVAALPKGTIIVDEAVMLTTYIEYLYESPDVSSYFSSNACLGWGLPAALGVSLAAPGRPVVALIGDGATLFGIQALWTAARYELPVVFVVLNNSGFNAIKWAFAAYPFKTCGPDADLGCDLGNVDFPGVAKAFGVDGERVEQPGEVRPAFERAIGAKKPALLDLILDPKDVGCGLPRLP